MAKYWHCNICNKNPSKLTPTIIIQKCLKDPLCKWPYSKSLVVGKWPLLDFFQLFITHSYLNEVNSRNDRHRTISCVMLNIKYYCVNVLYNYIYHY